MKMRAIAALVAILALGVGSMPALAGPNGGQDQFACIGDVPSTNPANTDFGRCAGPVRSQFGGVILDIGIHVYARLSGLTAGGITTAEFYVRGWEQIAAMGYTVADSYSPVANVVNGSMVRPTGALLDIRRVNIAFPSCQPDPLIGGTFVFLGAATGQVIGGSNIPNNTYLTVGAGEPPTSPDFNCALVTLCDAPAFTKVCVTGGQFIINPSGRNCTVGVAPTTWSELKGLYR